MLVDEDIVSRQPDLQLVLALLPQPVVHLRLRGRRYRTQHPKPAGNHAAVPDPRPPVNSPWVLGSR